MPAAIDSSGFHIAPPILSTDFACLGEEVCRVLESGADWIRFDIVDNHYVPNLTVGPLVCEMICPHAQKDGRPVPTDVHLMASPAGCIIPDFTRAGADLITFHPETFEHIDHLLTLIRDNDCKAGLIFNPATSLYCLDHVMDHLDIVLIIPANPSLGGQSLIPEVLNKLHAVRQKFNTYQDKTGRKTLFEIDRGVKANNAAGIAKAGADTFVADSAMLGKPDADGGYRGTVEALRQTLVPLT